MTKVLTLGLLLEEDNLLLGMKKRGFGAGRYNGFGGKVNPGETIDEGMIREYKEESRIEVLEFKEVGVIEFEFKGNPEILETHIYKILKYSGEPKETEEMKPRWFKTNEIPYDEMWPADKYWIPLFLDGKKFRGRVYFEDQNKVLDSNIKESYNF